jgi:hypothetical protein
MIRVNLLQWPVDKSTKVDFTNPATNVQVHSSPSPGFQIIGGDVAKASARVLEYLALAEFRALDPWERDDLRVSWLTVLYCSEIQDYSVLVENAQLSGKRVGESLWEYAFWMYYGKTFVEAHKCWAENRAQIEQLLTSLPQKKPAASVPAPRRKDKAA